MNARVILAGLAFAMLAIAGWSSELKDKGVLPIAPALNGIHPPGMTSPSSPDWHGTVIRSNGWSLENCTTCHGKDYAGGIAKVSCTTSGCHRAEDGGPEACYTCHGERDRGTNYPYWYATHGRHIDQGLSSSLNLVCTNCHPAITGFDDPNHIGGSNPDGAEVVLNIALANTVTIGTSGTPSFQQDGAGCANTYCHGNFTGGNNATVSWKGTDQAKCGSCHGNPATGDPKPKGQQHASFPSTCSNCHSQTVDANNNIIDKNLHVNGKLNVFGLERTDW